MLPNYEPNTLDMRLLGSGTILEPQAACDSPSRAAMRFGFLSQMLTLSNPSKRRVVTGAEREYGKYTMKIEVPCDAKVLKVVRKYPKHQGINSFKQNSETTIIYEDQSTGELGSIVVNPYHWNHKLFGFQYKYTDIFHNLTEGMILPKGTVLADSPSVQANGDYHYGIEANTIFMSHPGVIEDGIIVSEDFIQKTKSRGYGNKIMEWGQDSYPLNLYGTSPTDYKYFPDIGEHVRNDGILFALRKYDPILAVCEMTPEALMCVDHTFDNITYIPLSSVRHDNMPVVQDITVWKSHNSDLWRTPVKMEEQVTKYNLSARIYNTAINSVYEQEVRRRGKNNPIRLTHRYHAQLVDCRKYDNNIDKAQLPKSTVRTFRRQKLDHYRVSVTYGWDITPEVGSKYSDLHGCKGVIVAIYPTKDMPHYIDEFGNTVYADIITDGDATNRRTCYGRFNEQYINAATVRVENQCKQLIQQGMVSQAKEMLFDYYSVVSPPMYQLATQILPTEEDKINHTIEACNEGLQIYLPPDSPSIGARGIYYLMQDDRFRPKRHRVTYKDETGREVTTLKPFLIGSIYMLALEKIGDNWGATSIPKRQHHGIPGKLTDTDKSGLPWRDQSFKVFGESEVRLMTGVLDPSFVSMMVNLPNSPAMCEDVTRTLLTVDKPTDIDFVMDYQKHAVIQGRAVQYLHHMFSVAGIKMVRNK